MSDSDPLPNQARTDLAEEQAGIAVSFPALGGSAKLIGFASKGSRPSRDFQGVPVRIASEESS